MKRPFNASPTPIICGRSSSGRLRPILGQRPSAIRFRIMFSLWEYMNGLRWSMMLDELCSLPRRAYTWQKSAISRQADAKPCVVHSDESG